MQNTLNVAAPVSAPAKTNFCHPNNAPKTTATITREKTTIVIQKSETFHAENRENLENIVIFTSNIGSLPKLKRTTSDIGKSILLGGAKVRPTKQKSDYSISSRKRNSRGLYENYNEVYEELQSEQSPLLNIPSAREEISVRKDENSVLVYTTKRTSLPGANARHSWYAPVYRVLEEEGEGSSNVKESASLHNLAGVKKLAINGTHESASLLDNHQHSTPQTVVPRPAAVVCIVPSGNPENGGPSLGATASRKRKFEQFLKNLVSRRASKEPPSPPLITNSTAAIAAPVELSLKTSKRSPSEQNLTRSRLNGSTASLSDSVHQKLWSVVPLLRKNGSLQHISRNQPSSSSHMHRPPTFADIEYTGLRKCETVLALTTPHTEPIRPLNRLRHCASIATCSRCSSLLSLAAGSKYSLNCGVFIPVSSSGNLCTRSKDSGAEVTDDTSTVLEKEPEPEAPEVATTKFVCKLCLGEYTAENLTEISQCGCSFCTECMTAYVEFEIAEGAYEVSCPDAMCPAQGVISLAEIALLAASSLVEKHHRYRLNREVELDKYRTWCPKAGCETICLVGPTSLSPSPSTEKVVTFQPSSSKIPNPVAVHCPTCCDDFCSGCKKSWHPSMTCEENTKQLAATGKIETLGIPFDSDLIKCCPMCSVPIEKDEGCAQMMCKRCKHVFCWYCLASLDDDFLLRHYDKGPCKNKLGHSRASVVWHRAQVIGIFAGFGILLLVASPLLLLAAPCIVCCKCRICSGAAKMEDHDTDLDDGITLQR